MSSSLSAISPVDGRYHKQTQHLAAYFSEFALIRYRLHVEVEYFIALAEAKIFKTNKTLAATLRKMVQEFTEQDAQNIKQIESITNHDVNCLLYTSPSPRD